MDAGIFCAVVAGVLLLWRGKKPEPKWLFLTNLLEACAQNRYAEAEPPRAVGSIESDAPHDSEGRSNSCHN